MAVKSIGYASLPLPGLPFDDRKNLIPNDKGSIIDPKTGEKIKGLFTAGWVKRGPKGIIDATLRDAVDTFREMRTQIESGQLESKETSIEEVYNAIKV